MLYFVRGAAYIAGYGTTHHTAYITIGGVLSNRVGGYIEDCEIPNIVLGDTSIVVYRRLTDASVIACLDLGVSHTSIVISDQASMNYCYRLSIPMNYIILRSPCDINCVPYFPIVDRLLRGFIPLWQSYPGAETCGASRCFS